MIRRPQRSPLFPYPTLFRSPGRLRLPPAEPLPRGVDDTSVSVVIPARNEAARITPCIEGVAMQTAPLRSEEHTSELQSRQYLVCRLLLEKKKHTTYT